MGKCRGECHVLQDHTFFLFYSSIVSTFLLPVIVAYHLETYLLDLQRVGRLPRGLFCQFLYERDIAFLQGGCARFDEIVIDFIETQTPNHRGIIVHDFTGHDGLTTGPDIGFYVMIQNIGEANPRCSPQRTRPERVGTELNLKG